jgi:putative ABC transport system permease protein
VLIAEVLPLLLGIAVLVVIAVIILRLAEVGLGWLPIVAIVRAVVQLALVALLLQGALNAWWTVAAFIALMLTTASVTSLRRARQMPRGSPRRRHRRRRRSPGDVGPRARPRPRRPRVRAGHRDRRNRHRHVHDGGDPVDAALRCEPAHRVRRGRGVAVPRRPTAAGGGQRLRSESIREALLPNLDQTKNTGLVTLPGAFVGALFGGASPLEAAEFQIVVLASLILAGAITAVLGTHIAAGARVLPAPEE